MLSFCKNVQPVANIPESGITTDVLYCMIQKKLNLGDILVNQAIGRQIC
ncbi:MAG: hypothetical protein ACTHKK_07705 [Candidatus Nitrosocosmicus sp.]